MIKRKEDLENTQELCIMFAYCISLFAVGVFLFYYKILFGLGLVFVATLFLIPSLGEARKKIQEYTKKRRTEKLKKTRETIIIGGTPQKHHKKKKQNNPVVCPMIDDFVSKGKVMRELGLFYEKKQKKNLVSLTKIPEPTKASAPGRAYRQLNGLFDALNHHKKIRIAHHANIGSGHHGGSIRKMLETEAKRRGVLLSIRMKGEDIIIER